MEFIPLPSTWTVYKTGGQVDPLMIWMTESGSILPDGKLKVWINIRGCDEPRYNGDYEFIAMWVGTEPTINEILECIDEKFLREAAAKMGWKHMQFKFLRSIRA
jgi:hypothetical protein